MSSWVVGADEAGMKKWLKLHEHVLLAGKAI